jgi:hypothetical protein
MIASVSVSASVRVSISVSRLLILLLISLAMRVKAELGLGLHKLMQTANKIILAAPTIPPSKLRIAIVGSGYAGMACG